MTQQGGSNSLGNIYCIDTTGNAYKDLHDFNDTEGEYPVSSLISMGAKLYGMTFQGGINGIGCIFSMDTNGNNYKDIWNFTGGSAGSTPQGSLTYSSGVLYGVTLSGGTY